MPKESRVPKKSRVPPRPAFSKVFSIFLPREDIYKIAGLSGPLGLLGLFKTLGLWDYRNSLYKFPKV